MSKSFRVAAQVLGQELYCLLLFQDWRRGHPRCQMANQALMGLNHFEPG
jgi:hypothetical protein